MNKDDANKEVWVTELGFPVEETGSEKSPPVGAKAQCLLLRATCAMLQNKREELWVPHVIFYNIEDQPGSVWEHHTGVFNVHGIERPAWSEFKKFAGTEPGPSKCVPSS